MTGLGATLLPFSPEEREVALVWRAILAAELCLSEKPPDCLRGHPPKNSLNASVIAEAYVQSIYILRYLYKTEVFEEKRKINQEESDLSRYLHTDCRHYHRGCFLRNTQFD